MPGVIQNVIEILFTTCHFLFSSVIISIQVICFKPEKTNINETPKNIPQSKCFYPH